MKLDSIKYKKADVVSEPAEIWSACSRVFVKLSMGNLDALVIMSAVQRMNNV